MANIIDEVKKTVKKGVEAVEEIVEEVEEELGIKEIKKISKKAEKEEKDREAIADFWIAYRKTVQEIQNDNRPSNLNFGLL